MLYNFEPYKCIKTHSMDRYMIWLDKYFMYTLKEYIFCHMYFSFSFLSYFSSWILKLCPLTFLAEVFQKANIDTGIEIKGIYWWKCLWRIKGRRHEKAERDFKPWGRSDNYHRERGGRGLGRKILDSWVVPRRVQPDR